MFPHASPRPLLLATDGARRPCRRHLWELSLDCRARILQRSLPAAALRSLVAPAAAGGERDGPRSAWQDALPLCADRNPCAAAIEDALEVRHAGLVNLFLALSGRASLRRAWMLALDAGESAGALWAVLSHGECDAGLARELLAETAEVARGAASGPDSGWAPPAPADKEHAVLCRALAGAQRRCDTVIQAQRTAIEGLESEVLLLRGKCIASVTEIAALRDELREARAALPDRAARRELKRQLEIRDARNLRLQRENAELRAALDRRNALAAAPRTGPVAVKRFVKPPGKDFSTADRVICQTGCITHDAYWRIDEYCKRNGSRCHLAVKSVPAAPREAGAEPVLASMENGAQN